MLPRNPPIIFRVQNAAYSGIAELINFEHATTSTNQKKLHNAAPDLCLVTSQKIKTKIVTSEIFIRSKNIACYISIDNEIDVWPIIETIWQQGKNCYLPVCDPKIKNPLRFIKFLKHDELAITKYKILEPKICSIKIIAPQKLDLVIVPLLGFNNNRFRLGRGAGCYYSGVEML